MYGALECVGGEITGKVVEVRHSSRVVEVRVSRLRVCCWHVQLAIWLPLLSQHPSTVGRHLRPTKRSQPSQARDSTASLLHPPHASEQAMRDNGTVLIYGAMDAFDFTCPIPPLLFRWAGLPLLLLLLLPPLPLLLAGTSWHICCRKHQGPRLLLPRQWQLHVKKSIGEHACSPTLQGHQAARLLAGSLAGVT